MKTPEPSMFDECRERGEGVLDLVQHGNGKRNARSKRAMGAIRSYESHKTRKSHKSHKNHMSHIGPVSYTHLTLPTKRIV